MIELTCPAEEGIEAAALRKETRYQELQVAAKTWGECKYFTVEVARGLVGTQSYAPTWIFSNDSKEPLSKALRGRGPGFICNLSSP